MKVSYEYDQDPRYGWASIDIEKETDNLIIVHGKGGSYGFEFIDGELIPTCICHAKTDDECCCPNV